MSVCQAASLFHFELVSVFLVSLVGMRMTTECN